MSTNKADKYFTRKQGEASGISLSWNKQLGGENPVVASTSNQAELVNQPAQQREGEQDIHSVRLCEPLDEFNPDLDPEDQQLDWDHSGDLHSPPFGGDIPETADESNLENRVDESRWSTAFNRVNTTDTPDITLERLPRTRLGAVSDIESISQDTKTNLENIAEDTVTGQAVVPGKMDEETYKTRSSQFRKQFRDIEDLIKDFTEEDVFVQNVDSCEPLLTQIKNEFITLRGSLRNFYEEFDPEVHPDWERHWEEKLDVLAVKYKENDRKVRAKIQQIKADEAQPRVNGSNGVLGDVGRQDSLTSNDAVACARSKIERKDIISCLKDLQSQITVVGECSALEDFDVINI